MVIDSITITKKQATPVSTHFLVKKEHEAMKITAAISTIGVSSIIF
jgi:hypothetical protein